jgi:hypothetical protein
MVALGLVVLVAIGLLGRCGSSVLPPQLTAVESALVAATKLDYDVGVERHKFPVYSDRLVVLLRKTGVFRSVEYVDTYPSQPRLMARVHKEIVGYGGFPLWTLLTLGIWPSQAEEQWGEVFLLRASGGQEDVNVEFVYSGATTLGLWGGVQGIVSAESAHNPRDSDRYVLRLAHAICLRKEAILKLIGK